MTGIIEAENYIKQGKDYGEVMEFLVIMKLRNKGKKFKGKTFTVRVTGNDVRLDKDVGIGSIIKLKKIDNVSARWEHKK